MALIKKTNFHRCFTHPKFLIANPKKKKGSKIDNIDQNNNTRAFQVSVEDDGV
jgi:hypothetical protein